MSNIQGASLEEQVKKLLEQNLTYSREIYLISKKIKSYIMWGRIISIGSLFFFVVIPLILSVVYLPSLIKDGLDNIISPASILNSATPGISNPSVQELLNGTNIDQADLINSVQDQGGAVEAYKKILDLYKDQ